VLISLEVDGEKRPPEQVKLFKLVNTGDKYALRQEGQKAVIEGTFKLDPTQKPKVIDVYHDSFGDKPLKGIYSLEADTYKLCLPNSPEVEVKSM